MIIALFMAQVLVCVCVGGGSYGGFVVGSVFSILFYTVADNSFIDVIPFSLSVLLLLLLSLSPLLILSGPSSLLLPLPLFSPEAVMTVMVVILVLHTISFLLLLFLCILLLQWHIW